MNGIAILGLGKHLLVMINLKIIDKEDQYFLYYNQSLDLISMSNNYVDAFALDLDLISETNLDFLDMFSINKNSLNDKLLNI